MLEERQYFVYLLTNEGNGVLYVGMTNDLLRRIDEHRRGLTPGFTSRYRLRKLVYYEMHSTALDAITREKQLKAGSRKKKLEIIESMNPTWKDLSLDLM